MQILYRKFFLKGNTGYPEWDQNRFIITDRVGGLGKTLSRVTVIT
jgi:hypothetical protein